MSDATNNSISTFKPIIYREYLVNQDDFPTEFLPSISQYHFILGFASENYDVDTQQGTGHFKPTWNVDYITPQKVKKLKEDQPTAKVVISIGGVGTDYPFNPIEDKILWVKTAIASIKDIVHLYDNLIDGIDIHYDEIKTSDVDFVSYIGKVIKKLKSSNDTINLSLKVVSIAPTQLVQSHYHKLYLDNEDVIDWVDYRFYNQNVSSVAEFKTLYKEVVDAYDVDKVLPGVSLPDNPEITQGVRDLLIKNAIPGYFLWKFPNDAATGTTDPNFFLHNMLNSKPI